MIRRRFRAPRPAAWLAGAALSGLLFLLACGGPHEDRAAEQLYPEYCARCHGTDGKGDPRRVNLYPNLDLTRSKLTGKGAHFVTYRRIAQGYGPMPGFINRLSQVEIDRLADYSMKLNVSADGGRK